MNLRRIVKIAVRQLAKSVEYLYFLSNEKNIAQKC